MADVIETENANFADVSWHDNTLYGLRFDVGDPEAGAWHSDLVLDIDHIVEWVRGAEGGVMFRVAPATLLFHDVTDLKIGIDWGDSGHRTALHPASIDRVTRASVANQQICLDRPYYHWQITLNWPRGGEISFGASDFSQHLRAAPVLQAQQQLTGDRA